MKLFFILSWNHLKIDDYIQHLNQIGCLPMVHLRSGKVILKNLEVFCSYFC
jgi:hypothetical protein